jgi:hypothetical protein
MKKITIITVCLIFFIAGPSLAKDISFKKGLTQGMFKDLSLDAGGAISYKNMAPAEPLGITGFDAGIEASFIPIATDKDNYWQRAFDNDAPGALLLPKIRVRKGLAMGIDVGGSYAFMPGTNIKIIGVEISKAILEGGISTPAVGARATYTKLSGVDDLDLQTAGLDISISKGILMFTPYGGAGIIYVDSSAKDDLQRYSSSLMDAPLEEEQIWKPRFFAGVKISPMPLLSITAEAEYANLTIYSLKAALSF